MNSEIDRESYSYFLQEAQDLLQNIEQELLNIKEDHSTVRVHKMMRSAHTLKGAAASVGLEAIKEISHVLEDVFKTLYNPDVIIDDEIESLLFQGYECLRLPLMAHFNGGVVDESSMLDRAAGVISQLQQKLGDNFNTDRPLPTSEELGFDVVKSIFETGVEEKLTKIENTPPELVGKVVKQKAEVFLGLGESLSLPGYSAIAKTTLEALEKNPDRVIEIAQIALADFRAGQKAILAGDRVSGGSPSATLLNFLKSSGTGSMTMTPSNTNNLDETLDSTTLDTQPIPEEKITVIQSDIEPVESPPVTSESTEIISQAGININLDEILDSTTLDTQPIPEEKITVIQSDIEPVESPPVTSESTEIISQAGISLDEILDSTTLDTQPIPEEKIVDIDRITTSPLPSQTSKILAQEDFSLNEIVSNVTLKTQTIPKTKSTFRQSKVTTGFSSPRSQKRRPNSSPKRNQTDSRSESVRVEIEQLERLNHLAGELLINQNQQTSQDKQLRSIIQELVIQLQEHQQTLNELRDWSDRKWLNTKIFSLANHSTKSNLALETIFDPLEMDRYDDLQLIIQKATDETLKLDNLTEQIAQSSKQSQLSRESQQRLLNHVKDDLTTARMQPLGDLFNRFPRVIKQLVATNEKKAELILKGNEVLIDKAIVEKLYDPLLHLIRNAYDHGIDPEEVRLAAGKPEVGIIQVKAYHQGNRTMIEVQDDGNGIDLNRIAKRAIEMDLLTSQRAKTISEEELLELLFEPGFSTASSITDLSGRGVGLDVVRSQLQSLNGSVSVNTIYGQGTVFTLEIPLSLTVTDLLVCQAKEIVYAIPVSTIEQILIPSKDQLRIVGKSNPNLLEESITNKSEHKPILQWQQGDEEVLVPLYKLGDLTEYSAVASRFLPYNLNSTVKNTEIILANHSPIILLNTSNGLVGLQVEHILEEKELVIRTISATINPPSYVYGCCILGNSNLALVLDIEKLIGYQQENSQTLYSSLKETSNPLLPFHQDDTESNIITVVTSETPSQGNLLLVVDDSLTLRQTLTKTLSKFGYQVIQAKDGKEALNKLQQVPKINLVICDVEMPNINGFEFLNQINKNQNNSDLPVIMLTSRSSAKYRQIAQELGANAYMTKPFIEQELVSKVQKILTNKS